MRNINPDAYSNRTREDARGRLFSSALVAVCDVGPQQEDDDALSVTSSYTWDVKYEAEQEPDQLPTESKIWQKQFHMTEDDRIDMSKAVRGRIDTKNYVVFVRKTENHVSTIWKGREKRKFTHRQLEAQRRLDSAVVGGIRLFCIFSYGE